MTELYALVVNILSININTGQSISSNERVVFKIQPQCNAIYHVLGLNETV